LDWHGWSTKVVPFIPKNVTSASDMFRNQNFREIGIQNQDFVFCDFKFSQLALEHDQINK